MADLALLWLSNGCRFLSQNSVQRGKLQLVGVTALMIAAKFEEIFPPPIKEFVYITDNTYINDQARVMLIPPAL